MEMYANHEVVECLDG